MSVDADELRGRYLAALRRAVTGSADRYPYRIAERPNRPIATAVFDAAHESRMELVTREPPARSRRGFDRWSVAAQTTMGPERLEHLQDAVQTVLREGVPGDLIEAGTWRGGGAILMRAVLHAHGVDDRMVWASDPDLSVDEIKANFAAYDLLDDQVRVLPGALPDALPGLADRRWAIIRVDGGLHEPTVRALEHLYRSLAEGGFLIIDDYGATKACKQAVRDFRRAHAISESLTKIDWTGVFWRKAG